MSKNTHLKKEKKKRLKKIIILSHRSQHILKKKQSEQSVPNWKAKTRQDLTQRVLDSIYWQIRTNPIRKIHPTEEQVAQENHQSIRMAGSHLAICRKWKEERERGIRDFNSFNTPCNTIFCFPFTSLITILNAT